MMSFGRMRSVVLASISTSFPSLSLRMILSRRNVPRSVKPPASATACAIVMFGFNTYEPGVRCRVLYGLDAILRLHVAQENELYHSLAESERG